MISLLSLLSLFFIFFKEPENVSTSCLLKWMWNQGRGWEVWRGDERGRDWKMQWMEEVSRRNRGLGEETTEELWRGGGYRYTVFLGETIITMSNGSSHQSLPQPSTVISRTFFFQPATHVKGSGKPHSACWTCPLSPPHTPLFPHPYPSCWRAGQHYLGGCCEKKGSVDVFLGVINKGLRSFTASYNISHLSSWKSESDH